MVIYDNYTNDDDDDDNYNYTNDYDDDYAPSPKRIHRREVFLQVLGTETPSRSSCGCENQHHEHAVGLDDDFVYIILSFLWCFSSFTVECKQIN